MTTSERGTPAPALGGSGRRSAPPPAEPLRSFERRLLLVAAAVAGVALVWAAVAARVWIAAANDPDSAASVLFFQRITSGRHLEAFVATTPKPLLTLMYGVAMAITGDWRSLEVVAILAFAAAAGLAAVLAGRALAPAGPPAVAGGVAFAAVSLPLWPDALAEVYSANSFVWALAFWLAAAVAITGPRPRYWLAGAALFLSGLVRTESWLLVGLATLAVAGLAAYGAWRGDARAAAAARRATPLLLGLLAPVVACIHDLLLTGSPLYWQHVPAGYTAVAFTSLGRSVGSFGQLARDAFTPFTPFAALAIVGLAWLARTRRVPLVALAVAMAWLAAGIVALIWFVSRGGTFVTARYFEQVMAVGIVAAALGVGWVVGAAVRALARGVPADPRGSSGAATLGGAAAAGAVAAIALSLFTWGLPSAIDDARNKTQHANERFDSVAPTVCAATSGATGATLAVSGVPLPVVDERAARVFVPRPLVNRVVAQCHADVRAVGDTFLAFAGGRDPSSVLKPGDLLLHDRALDGSGGPFASLETASPVDIGSVRLRPIEADAGRGIWLYLVEAP